MLKLTIQGILERIYGELSSEFINIEPYTTKYNDIEVTTIKYKIEKGNLKFTKFKNFDDRYELEITANNECIFSGIYDVNAGDYNEETSKLLWTLWKRLEGYFELRKETNLSEKLTKITNALKGDKEDVKENQ